MTDKIDPEPTPTPPSSSGTSPGVRTPAKAGPDLRLLLTLGLAGLGIGVVLGAKLGRAAASRPAQATAVPSQPFANQRPCSECEKRRAAEIAALVAAQESAQQMAEEAARMQAARATSSEHFAAEADANGESPRGKTHSPIQTEQVDATP